MENYQVPICIIGAGPAGLACAFHLNRLGIDHLILEAKTFPRDKVCGEAYDGRVTHLLNEISPDLLPEMKALGIIEESRSYSVHLRGFILPVTTSEAATSRIQTRRQEFDAFLAGKVGENPHTELRFAARVTAVEERKDRVCISFPGGKVTAQLVICATGAQTPSSAQRGRPKTLFLRQDYRNFPTQGRRTEFHFFDDPFVGGLYINPISHGLTTVQLGITEKKLKQAGMSMQELFDTIIRQPAFADRFGEAIPVGGRKGTYLPIQNRLDFQVTPRKLQCGAGLLSVNTATGMGVGNAMVMGKRTAEHAAQCLADQVFSIRRHQKLRHQLRLDLRSILWYNRLLNFFQVHIERFLPILFWLFQLPYFHRMLQHTDFLSRLHDPRFHLSLLFPKPTVEEDLPSENETPNATNRRTNKTNA